MVTLVIKTGVRQVVPLTSGSFDKNDNNACTCRALANATGMHITEATSLLAKHGRKKDKGATFVQYEQAYHEAGLQFVGFFGTTQKSQRIQNYWTKLHKNAARHKGTTLENFCKNFNNGRFVVIVDGHATCVINGELVDTFNNRANRRVLAAWQAVE